MDRAESIAREIISQHRAGRNYRQLTGDYMPRDIDEAYAAQTELHEVHAREGRGLLGGRKIALASKVQQELCGVDHPIAGGIFKNEILDSPAKIALSDYHGLGIEFELAIEIERTISRPGLDRDSIRHHIAAIRPAFELIIDREADYAILDARTMIADNAWCAGVVIGDPIEDWHKLDIDTLPCRLDWTGEDPAEAVSGDTDPIGSLVWVANLVTSQGLKIPAGDVVITGSVIKTRYPQGGEQIRYTIADQSVELTIS